ncbi:MAG: hypothetical protein NZV14_17545 [Bryobacteraceae bacterium]|nr:hypothetical protein [Bryobacteraceae bacterium]MDW8379967.1 hypothetical protein [Bryobacterales bacterium]
MSSRADIDAGRLIYTCHCGWIDKGHANPRRTSRPHVGALALWDQFLKESGERSEFDDGFQVIYTQDMGKFGFTLGVTRSYFVRRGLSIPERESIALAIFMEVSGAFEDLQGQFPSIVPGLGRVADSSYSQEDLISNLLGFYKAVRPGTDYLQLCAPVSVEASKKVWDQYGSVGSIKNKNFFKPITHPCEECKGRSIFPPQLQVIQPAQKEPLKKGAKFRDWSWRDSEKRDRELNERLLMKDRFGPKW